MLNILQIRHLILWHVLFIPTLLFAQEQSPSLFLINNQATTNWSAKSFADVQMVPVDLNSDVLQAIRNESVEKFQFKTVSEEIHEVSVRRVIDHVDGSWSFTGHINNSWKNSFILSVSDGRVLSAIHEVSEHQFFEIRYSDEHSSHILVEIDPHERDEVSCGTHDVFVAGDSINNQSMVVPESNQGSAVIDVMIVYTPNAESWAQSNSGGINNVINQAMAIAQLSADNSGLDLEFRLVHRTRVNYSETGNSSNDLRNLTFGNISNVYNLRDQYGADLVAMFTRTNDAGGIAWRLNSTSGRPDYGYSITRVQQAGWSNTHAHELGHNLGNAHSRNQTRSAAGSAGGLFNYSTGWRWTGQDGRRYASVMTYAEGSNNVDIFSNPDISYRGTPTGSYSGVYSPADNARSMSRIKHTIASYRPTRFIIEPPSVSTTPISSVTESSANAGGNVTDDGGTAVTSRGVCWNTHQNPNLSDTCTSSGSGTGSFSVSLSGLKPDTRYYVRAYAVNNAGTEYGNQRNFTTLHIPADPGLSTITASDDRIQANDQDSSVITVTAIDENGNTLQGYDVTLISWEGTLRSDRNSVVTNQNGEAAFSVTNNRVETVVYSAIIENIEIHSSASVTFIPVAPVSLAATEVETRQFVSNWEVAENSDGYLIDVATDSSFANFESGYQAYQTGNVTSQMVDGVQPGTDYYYRVRAQSMGVIGANSESIPVTTFPVIPEAISATNRNALQFTANWQAAEGARNYRLDVSGDPEFQSFVAGYHDTDVGDTLSETVTGLTLGTDYYYRVRSEAGPRVSTSSATIQTSTLSVNRDNSEISSEQLRILADGNQTNTIEIVVKSDEGYELENLKVNLKPEGGSSEIEGVQSVTNESGIALFRVTNTVAENVTYEVQVETISLGEISVEFLQDDGVLKLGDNYPNPFDYQTTIPVTVPSSMSVELTIYNSLGNPVRTIINEELETGHHEIPFQTSELAAGVYFYRLYTADQIKTEKMVFVK